LVTGLPLSELWHSAGTTLHTRLKPLATEDIAELLRAGVVEFVVADLDKPLIWIAPTDCFEFWKAEVKPHLAAPDSRMSLEAFPGGYAYFASSWSRTDFGGPIVLLERHH
jgi:hypothetical protein